MNYSSEFFIGHELTLIKQLEKSKNNFEFFLIIFTLILITFGLNVTKYIYSKWYSKKILDYRRSPNETPI